MKFSEFDLEQAIWDDYFYNRGAGLIERGLMIQPLMKRQLKIGNYGIADLVGYDIEYKGSDRYIKPTIYELKKNEINVSTFLQALGYAKGIVELSSSSIAFPNIVLIGSEVDLQGNFCFITEICPQVSIYTVEIEVDGLHFVYQSHFNLASEGLLSNDLCFSDYRKLLS